MTFQLWREILEYARWAPSPHNTQHWKFRLVDERRAVLLYDPTRLLPVEDPTGRFMACGLGLMIETISVAAAPHGLELKVKYLGVPLDANVPGPAPYAELELVERTTAEPLDRQLILQRRTSRLPYKERPVDEVVLRELAAVAAQYDHKMEFSSEQKDVDWILALNADTMFFDLRDEKTRREIEQWSRYSMAQARRQADGLAAFAMRFPGWMFWLFMKHNWVFQIPGLSRLCRWIYLRSMRGTRTVAWLSGAFETQEECLATGRMLARVWLTMTSHGVYLHPFGSVITNARSHKVMEDHFSGTARVHPLWLLVRLGYSDQPPRAMRLSLDEILVQGA